MEDRLSDDDVLADLEVAAVGMLEELSTDENGEARLFNNSNSRAGRRRNAPASPGAFVDVTSAQTTPSGFKSKRKKQDEITPEVLLPTSTRLHIRVNRICVAAEWKWKDVGDDTCGICRSPFEACCVNCKMPGEDCPLVIGVCKHAFHMHCIYKWTEAQNVQRPQCPLCRQEWKFS